MTYKQMTKEIEKFSKMIEFISKLQKEKIVSNDKETAHLCGDIINALCGYKNYLVYEKQYDCHKELKNTGIIGEFTGIPITVDCLQKIINEYFDVPNDTYCYNLTRVKSAFEVGTISLDDLQEFN